jgi:hypothetical protein
MTTRRSAPVLLAPVFVAATLFLGACGSKGTTTTANKVSDSTTIAGGATTVVGAPTTLDANGNGPRPTFDPALMKPYTDCMKEHGVDAANLGRGGRGGRNGQGDPNASSTDPTTTTTVANAAPTTTLDPAVVDAARTACADKRPAGFGAGGQGGQGGVQGGVQNNQAMQAYRSCLKDNGVTLPDRGQPGQPGQPGAQPGQPGAQPGQPGDNQPTEAQAGAAPTSPPTFPKNSGSVDPNAPGSPDGGQPDPNNPQGGRGGRGGPLAGLDQNDPVVKVAVEKCAVLLPQRPADGTASTTTTA